MLRQILLVFSLLLSTFSASAQKAKDIMDATAAKLQAMPAIEAQFEAGTFEGATPMGAALTGKMVVQKEMLRMESSEVSIWCDGTTQWTLHPAASEVNVSTPTKEEMSLINPYTFIHCYKKGFKLSLSSADYHGTPAHEIRMLPQSKNGYEGIYEIRLTIDKKTSLPLCVRLRDKGNTWTRIRISRLKSLPAADVSHFRFNSIAHPDLEMIDLR